MFDQHLPVRTRMLLALFVAALLSKCMSVRADEASTICLLSQYLFSIKPGNLGLHIQAQACTP